METPELVLAKEEAEALAAAVQNVNDQYSATLSPKILAWMQLGMIAGSIYGTRVYAIRARHLAAGGAKRDRVVNFPGPEKAGSRPAGGDTGGGPATTPADLFGLDYSASIAAEV